MRARLDPREQKRLCQAQAHLQTLEFQLHVSGTDEEVARQAEAASSELALLATDIRLRLRLRVENGRQAP